MKQQVADVTARIVERSRQSRRAYLDRLSQRRQQGPRRRSLSCGNLAHAVAACSAADKAQLTVEQGPNIAIVTAYNDMLSAHQPYREVPELLKSQLAGIGATGQVAGGVPAMCDGVTQGQDGMELSLFSRDLIAMATAVSLSHDVFDGALLLGICDKIVPGLLIGALRFGELPMLLVPSGPMPSGLPNKEKAAVRQAYAAGELGREDLLAAETASYHAPGTCTFYGTANSNQLLMEVMGLHLPGASFVSPGTAERDAFHRAAASQVVALTRDPEQRFGIGQLVNERSLVNAVVALLATGGSTNHTLHLPAIAAAAGIHLGWDDLSDLSAVVPQLTRIYPNGSADINHFQAAGGMAFLIATLLDHDLLHEDVLTVNGARLNDYRRAPVLQGAELHWPAEVPSSGDRSVLRAADEPFAEDGGMRVLRGNLGTAVIKTSAVAPEHRVVHAPARVFDDQDELREACESGQMNQDVVAVVRFQGPQANGMPELHKLTPYLAVLQDRGFHVALVTDGRMSGASGKVPAAIHLTPEAIDGGAIGRIRDGDLVRLDAESGTLELQVKDAELSRRSCRGPAPRADDCGRDLFAVFRRNVGLASSGASIFDFSEKEL